MPILSDKNNTNGKGKLTASAISTRNTNGTRIMEMQKVLQMLFSGERGQPSTGLDRLKGGEHT
jgi:hypothetical protein